jgi:NAD-dependent SIR2 family protein deacetylase
VHRDSSILPRFPKGGENLKYTVQNILTYWRRSAQSNEKIGWILYDHEQQESYGYTEEEAWELINSNQCKNALAVVKDCKTYQKKMLQPANKNTPPFYDTSWQIPYQKVKKDVKLSEELKEEIDTLLHNDFHYLITKKTKKWKRKNKDLFSTFQTYEYVMNCVEIAQRIGKANKIVVFTGTDIWKETGLPIYEISKLKDFSILSIKHTLENYIDIDYNAKLPKLLDLIKPTDTHKFITELELLADTTIFTECIDDQHKKAGSKNVHHVNINIWNWQCEQCRSTFTLEEVVRNASTQCLMPSCNGNIHCENKKENLIDTHKATIEDAEVILVLGTTIDSNILSFNNNATKVFLSNDVTIERNEHYDFHLTGPLSMMLEEIESHIVKKGRSLCNVCDRRVSLGVGASTIAPISISICPVCSSRGAQPYGVVVTYVAIRKARFENYKPNAFIQHVIKATLEICKISMEQFDKDVQEEVVEFKNKLVK